MCPNEDVRVYPIKTCASCIFIMAIKLIISLLYIFCYKHNGKALMSFMSMYTRTDCLSNQVWMRAYLSFCASRRMSMRLVRCLSVAVVSAARVRRPARTWSGAQFLHTASKPDHSAAFSFPLSEPTKTRNVEWHTWFIQKFHLQIQGLFQDIQGHIIVFHVSMQKCVKMSKNSF